MKTPARKSVAIVCGLVLVFILWLPLDASAQEHRAGWANNTFYKEAQQKYGTDKLTVFGKLYLKRHYLADGHPFLEQERFINGDIYINDKAFQNIPSNIDIERQALVISDGEIGKSEKFVWLNPMRIDSAKFDKRLFIHSVHLPGSNQTGYYEVIKSGSLMLLDYHTKYHKTVKNVTASTKGGKYTNPQTTRSLLADGMHIRANTRRAFIGAFDENKREIRQFMRRNRINYKKAKPEDLQKLMDFCSQFKNKKPQSKNSSNISYE